VLRPYIGYSPMTVQVYFVSRRDTNPPRSGPVEPMRPDRTSPLPFLESISPLFIHHKTLMRRAQRCPGLMPHSTGIPGQNLQLEPVHYATVPSPRSVFFFPGEDCFGRRRPRCSAAFFLRLRYLFLLPSHLQYQVL